MTLRQQPVLVLLYHSEVTHSRMQQLCNQSCVAWSICIYIPVWTMYLALECSRRGRKLKQSAERPYKPPSRWMKLQSRVNFGLFSSSLWERLFGLPSHFISFPQILIINTWMRGWLTKLANVTAHPRRMPFHVTTSTCLSSMSGCRQLTQNQDG